jgi:ABC-2 type transport system permease protein
MRTILFIVQKEFLQTFRNKGMLVIILVLPFIQLLILSHAADFEIKNLKIFYIDKDQSPASNLLLNKLEGSKYFEIEGTSFNTYDGEVALLADETDLVIEIPSGFEREIVREGTQKIQLVINAIDGTKAGLGNYYANAVIQDFNTEIIQQYGSTNAVALNNFKNVKIEYSNWYNPSLDYKTFMVPGILVLLITMIAAFLSAMNIVREKEIGTIEQINVTPIKKYQFLIGKLFPFWVLGLFELTVGLMLAKFIFHVPFLGSIFIIYGFSAVYLLLVLGMGLLISTLTDTQQQAMFISWFFLVIFILMSGLFTPIENMPLWAQKITLINPIRYFIEVVRMVMLKGSGFKDITNHLMIVFGYAAVLNALAAWRYKKTV